MTDLASMFDGTAAAETVGPVPAGEYHARWVACGLDESRKGTPYFFGRFEIASGGYAGRRLVHRWFLSKAALPYSRRDLAALGLTAFAQLQSGVVPGGPVVLRVALRRDDSGAMWNEVRAVVPADGAAITQHNEAATADPLSVVSPAVGDSTASAARVDEVPAALIDPDLI